MSTNFDRQKKYLMSKQIQSKWIFCIGAVLYLILLSLSVLFYKERTVFLDISYHLFCILKDGTFAIQNNRFGAAVTQAFPLLGSKMGLSISNIALIYSMSFVVFYASAFIIIFQVIKNTKFGIAFLLFSILMTTHTFFWIQSELPQGVAFLFIFLSLFDNILNKNVVPLYFSWLSPSLLFIICFTHPLLLFVALFSFSFLYLNYPDKRKFILFQFLIYATFLLIKSIFFKTAYDSQAIGGLKNIFQLFPHYFNIQSNKNFLHYFLKDYFFIPIIMSIVGIYYIRCKLYAKIFLMFFYSFIYIFIVNTSYPQGADQFYLENQYLLISSFVAIPFAFDFLPSIKNLTVPVVLIGVISFVGIVRIFHTHHFYTHRLEWYRHFLHDTNSLPQKKIVLTSKAVPLQTLLMTWGSSYEFWLLSSMEYGQARSIIIEENKDEFAWAIDKNKSFITKWGAFNYNELNSKYFIFSDTNRYIKK
ncbi:MAG: hypothetical protein QM530_00630 [Phycisphaerales bacterium]|nr:hypothetical protein [Phycisphaerales bacterium]